MAKQPRRENRTQSVRVLHFPDAKPELRSQQSTQGKRRACRRYPQSVDAEIGYANQATRKRIVLSSWNQPFVCGKQRSVEATIC